MYKIESNQVVNWRAARLNPSMSAKVPVEIDLLCWNCRERYIFRLGQPSSVNLPFSTKPKCGRCNESTTFILVEFLDTHTDPASISEIGIYSYPKPRTEQYFNIRIEQLSPNFVEIYNQAFEAEKAGMDHLNGIGYRKALEFLIKDFLVEHKYKNEPNKQDEVRKQLLGPCIKNHVDDPRMQTTAEKAIWLGNDETHYTRKWQKSIDQLKSLIDLTVHWVEAELIAAELIASNTPGVERA